MDDRDKVIKHLKNKLETRSDVHAFWLEGSMAQGYADEFSDIDIWLSVDDDKIFTIYEDIEAILSEIAPIDFTYVVKRQGDLGHTVYHLQNTSEFLAIDINTQKLSRQIILEKDIDDASVIFDKKNTVKIIERTLKPVDITAKRDKLRKFYELMKPNVVKNIRRGRLLEAMMYYHFILRYATKFLWLKHGAPEKAEFDLKHFYRVSSENESKELQDLYDVKSSEIESNLPKLKAWIDSL